MLNSATLYKYVAPGLAGILETNLLRFTQATAFNDPFENLACTESIFEADWVEDALAHTATKKPSLATVLALLKEPLAHYLELRQPGAKEATSKFMQSLFDNRFGCLCLASCEHPGDVPDNLLMWSHYAESHKGFVLGFDKKHPYFHQTESGRPYFGKIRPVRYTLERPRGPIVSDPTMGEAAIFYELGERFFFRKSQHWEYEQEWRLIRELKDANQILPGGIHLFSFPEEALTTVVLGCRIARDTEDRLRKSLSEDRYRHVTLSRARIDPEAFRLNIEQGDPHVSRDPEVKSGFRDPAQREKLAEVWSSLEKIWTQPRR